jgi:hypothetical protein
MAFSSRWVLALSFSIACGDDDTVADAGRPRDGGQDAGAASDAGADAEAEPDAGVIPEEVELYLLTVMNRIVRIVPSDPETVLGDVAVTGVPMRVALVGIDVRPMSGELYALGSNGQLYLVDPMTGAATAAGPALAPVPEGMSFGFDFTPMFDRIRLSSDTGINLRVNPDSAMIVTDTPLAYAEGDPGQGMPLAVTALAYSDPRPTAPATTLFGIDVMRDVLVVVGGRDGMPSPNGGQVSTVGALGLDVNIATGFDAAIDGRFYAVLNRDAEPASELYAINADTGAATLVGIVGTLSRVRGLAVALPPP